MWVGTSASLRRVPKIAEPTRTLVAPKRDGELVVGGHAHREPVDAGLARQLLQQREMRPRILVGRRDAHQPVDRQAMCVAAARDEGDRLAGLDARLLRFGTGVDLNVEAGDRPCRAISLASSAAILSRSTVSMTSNSATACLALLDCSGPIRCSSMSGNSALSAGHLPSASCTRFSPKTRWPASSSGRIAGASKVLETATSVDRARRAAGRLFGGGDLRLHLAEFDDCAVHAGFPECSTCRS